MKITQKGMNTMSEKLLLDILSELKFMREELSSVKSQTEENTQLLQAVIHRQEESDAKIDNMAMDVHKLHGEVAAVKDQTATNTELKAPLDSVIARVADLETDIKIMKKAISH